MDKNDQPMSFISSSSNSDPQIPDMMMPMGGSFMLPKYYQQNMVTRQVKILNSLIYFFFYLFLIF